MRKYKFMKAIDEEELERKIHKFQEKYFINSIQYSTSAYPTKDFHNVWHCVMIEYEEYKKE